MQVTLQTAIISHLYVVTSLRHLKAFPIITGELVLLAATDLQDLGAGLPLLADIVHHQPLVSSYWQSIRVQHSERLVCVMIMSHSPLLIFSIP